MTASLAPSTPLFGPGDDRFQETEPRQAIEALVNQPALDRAERRQLQTLQARRLIWEGALVLDARSKEEFDRSHLQGAISMPLECRDAEILRLLPDPMVPILCYSNGQNRAQELMAKLKRLGYGHAYGIACGLQLFTTVDR